MSKEQEPKKILGVKKETLIKVVGWTAVGLIALGLMTAFL